MDRLMRNGFWIIAFIFLVINTAYYKEWIACSLFVIGLLALVTPLGDIYIFLGRRK